MIIFTDLSEVLIRGVYGMEEIIEERYGKKVAKKFLRRRRAVNDIFRELLRGHISEEVFWLVLLQDGNWPFDSDELQEILSINLIGVIPDTIDVYQRIIGYPDSISNDSDLVKGRPEIWLVSDHIAERALEIEYLHQEVFDLTSRWIWSFKYRQIKSDPNFFPELISDYELIPEEIVFVDDLQENLDAAASTGITCIKFENAEQLEADLSELGFLFADTVEEANELNSHGTAH